MHYLRLAVIVLFVVSAGLFAVTEFNARAGKDSVPPELTADSEYIEMSVNDPEDKLMEGVRATDARDGELTDRILMADESFFMEKGECTVNYVVFDYSNNYSTLSRTVRYTDYRSPRFVLKEPLVFSVGSNIKYMDKINADDVLDGEISNKIRIISSTVSNYSEGVYPVRLEVINSHGDKSQVDINVVVRSGVSDAMVELSDYVVYTRVGEEFDPYSLITDVKDSQGESIPNSTVVIRGMVDTNVPGCYTLMYTYENGTAIDGVYLTVVVEDEQQ